MAFSNDFLKNKKICIAKETIHKRKMEPIKWEKILTKDISNKYIREISTLMHGYIEVHVRFQKELITGLISCLKFLL